MTAAGAGRLLAVDAGRPLGQEPGSGHNRWHPDVPPLARVHAGERLVVETRDGIDGQVGPSTRPEDLLGLDMRRGHPLTGPIFVEEAAPGDLLEIEVLDVETAGFGFTCVRPGSGILGDRVRTPLLVRWDLSRGVARSSDLPGVAIPGGPFVGVIGLAPSHRRLAAQAERERELAAARGAALPPEPGSAVPASGEAALRGLRTVPPRENGGNLDVRHLGAGSRAWIPIDVAGGLLSLGDVHFAQGDGECCGQAVEAAGRVHLALRVHPGGGLGWRPRTPVIEAGPARQRRSGRRLVTTGLPLDAAGRNRDRDLYLAARMALEQMTDHLVATRGFTFEQAYALCSVAVDLEISQLVNLPNVLVSAVLGLDVFDDGRKAGL